MDYQEWKRASDWVYDQWVREKMSTEEAMNRLDFYDSSYSEYVLSREPSLWKIIKAWWNRIFK